MRIIKRIFHLFLFLFILLLPQSGQAKTAYVNESSINIRSGPGIGFSVIALGKKDQPLSVLEETQGKWTQIMTRNQKKGWISTKMITYEKPINEIIIGYKEIIEKQGQEIASLKMSFHETKQTNETLLAEVEQLRDKGESLQSENNKLKRSRDLIYIGASALAVLIIWTMGFIAGHFRMVKENKRFKTMTSNVHKELKSASI